MKKLVVISVLFALLTGAAFAQLTFTGNFQTGMLLTVADSNTAGIFEPKQLFRMHNVGAGGNRLELNSSWTREGGKAGGQIRFRSNILSLNNGFDLSFNIARVWFKPMDMLTINVGRLDQNGDYETRGGVNGSNSVGGGLGMLFEVVPMTGVKIGFGVYPYSGSGVKDATGSNTARGQNLSKANYKLGLNYLMPNLVRVVLNTGIDYVPNALSGSGTGDEARAINLGLGADILALSSMGFTRLAIDFNLGRLDKFSDAGIFQVGQQVTWASGDMGVTLRAIEYIPMGATEKGKLGVDLRLNGTYKMGDITPGIDIGFAFNGGLHGNATSGTNGEYRAWDGLARANARVEKRMAFIINPNVAIAVTNGTTLTVGYSAAIQQKPNVMFHSLYATLQVNF